MEMFFERILDPYFLWALVFALGGNSVLGFVVQLAKPDIDILFVRRWVRNLLILVACYLLFVAYQPSPEFDPQSVLPKEETDWFDVGLKFFGSYLGAWAFLSGLEKYPHNLFMFFDSSFYREIKKSDKKKK